MTTDVSNMKAELDRVKNLLQYLTSKVIRSGTSTPVADVSATVQKIVVGIVDELSNKRRKGRTGEGRIWTILSLVVP